MPRQIGRQRKTERATVENRRPAAFVRQLGACGSMHSGAVVGQDGIAIPTTTSRRQPKALEMSRVVPAQASARPRPPARIGDVHCAGQARVEGVNRAQQFERTLRSATGVLISAAS